MRKLTFALLTTIAIAFAFLIMRGEERVTSSTVQTKILFHPSISELKVIQESRIESDLQLELHNTSEREITAFVITAYDRLTKQEGTTHRMDYAFSDNEAEDSIVPGQKVVFQGSFSSDLKDNEFVLRAVVFTDGTFKGDPQAVQQIFDYRRGQRAPFLAYTKELESAITRLDKQVASRVRSPRPAVDFFHATMKPELNRVRAAIRINSKLLGDNSKNESNIYKSALQFGETHLLKELEELDAAEATNDLPALWGKVKYSEERWRKFCARMQAGGDRQ